MWSPFFFAGKSGAAGAKKFVSQLFFRPFGAESFSTLTHGSRRGL
jgi:hypothetical protein